MVEGLAVSERWAAPREIKYSRCPVKRKRTVEMRFHSLEKQRYRPKMTTQSKFKGWDAKLL